MFRPHDARGFTHILLQQRKKKPLLPLVVRTDLSIYKFQAGSQFAQKILRKAGCFDSLNSMLELLQLGEGVLVLLHENLDWVSSCHSLVSEFDVRLTYCCSFQTGTWEIL